MTVDERASRAPRSAPARGSDREYAQTAGAPAVRRPALLGYQGVLALHRAVGNRAVSRLLLPGRAESLTTGPGAQTHQDQIASPVPLTQTAPTIVQTKPQPGGEGTRPAPEPPGPARALIVEDGTETLQPGQMRKSEFLSQLRSAVCSAAEEALAGTIWSAMGCPYIERWFSYYAEQSSQHVERAIRKYAPEAADVRSARAYIPIVTRRVRRGIAEWVATGEVSGVPEELASALPGGGLLGVMGGLLGGVGALFSGLVSGLGSLVSGLGSLFFKQRAGGAPAGVEPGAVQAQLGSGHALASGVQTRMEAAFGVSFAGVRIHTDTRAADLSQGLNARAFTVGRNVAFGPGEYQPGTLIGDALIAHELAHVVQQGGGNGSGAAPTRDGAAYSSLEEDADVAAVGAMVSAWSETKGSVADIGRNAMPSLRSGLRLQRCGTTAATQRQTTRARAPLPSLPNWERDVQAAQAITDTEQRRDAMVALVRQPLGGTGIQVEVAGNSSPTQVHPDDYRPAPVLNFDINLNNKSSWPSSPGAPTRSLSNNYGYFFTRGSAAYAIIGPRALDPRSPAFTRMYAEHELYHTQHHVGGTASFDDEELETWTQDFRNYFHHLYRFRQQWEPLVGYYERATQGARQRALDQLVDYYNNPPVPADQAAAVQAAFGRWLRRRLRDPDDASKQLIQDLESRLHLGTSSSTSSGRGAGPNE